MKRDLEIPNEIPIEACDERCNQANFLLLSDPEAKRIPRNDQYP
jgi:hypothetical protein